MTIDTSKIIHAPVGGARYTVTSALTKTDYGIIMLIEGVELPNTYQVDFSNDEHNGDSLTMIGNADGVEIPKRFIDTGKDVFAWLYWVGDGYGKNVYKFRIPNKVRPNRTNVTPTPEEQGIIDQAISALNDAVESAEGYAQTASDKADSIHDMTATAETLPEGSEATASYDAETGVMSFGIPRGATGAQGEQGIAGRDGVDGQDGYSPTASVSKSGKTATITITDKNGTTSAQVSDGTDGTDGFSPTVEVTDITGGHRVVITDKDGTESFDVEDGATGATPNLTIGTVETLEPTESATATITGTPENPVLNIGIPQGEQGEVTTEEFLKAFVTDSASGSIASFLDGADNLPLKSLIVNIDPVQDLSQGDPSPTNICPITGWTGMTIHRADGENPHVVDDTISISWQTEAGTVYGGKLDVLTGVLTVDKIFASKLLSDSDFAVVSTGTNTIHYRYYGAFFSERVENTNEAICNIAPYMYNSSDTPHFYPTWNSANEQARLDIWLPIGTDTSTEIQACAKLTTPKTYQLTPQQIRSLYGNNTIFADTGDSAVEYRADTKLYISRLTEPDADMIADSNIVSGQYFMVGNSLFKATANIASGRAIIVGTNCTRKSLSEALNEINA